MKKVALECYIYELIILKSSFTLCSPLWWLAYEHIQLQSNHDMIV